MRILKPLPPSIPLPDTIGQLVAGARQKLKQAVYLGMVPLDLTPQQYWMLLVLLEQGPQSLHQLAKRIFVDDPTASRLLKTLVDRDILRTSADPTHGRRIIIDLGPEGEILRESLLAFTRDLRIGIQEGLTPEETATLVHLLGKVLTNLDATAHSYREAAETFRTRHLPGPGLKASAVS